MDIELFLQQSPTGTSFDIAVANGDLAHDHDIKTAVFISLFTDHRANDDDALPDPTGSKRGWVGDVFMPRPLGSRLWLLGREKQLQEVLNRAKEYAQESLAWLVADGIASAVSVEATAEGNGVLALDVSVQRERRTPWSFRYEFAWNGATTIRS